MPCYDCHAHLADPRVLPSLTATLSEATDHGVCGILANAARLSEWPAIIEMSQHQPVLGALGLHPFFLDEWSADVPDRLEDALQEHERIRAVGEIGLDFYEGRDDLPKQVEVFAAQLDAAVRLNKPVVFHNRKSWNEFFTALRNTGPVQGACHHFSGSLETARQALDTGLFLSFCGPLTYANARRLKEAARYTPLDRILTETDTPDLPPEQHRGEQSRPHHVHWVVTEIARVKGITPDDVSAAVEANFTGLFGKP